MYHLECLLYRFKNGLQNLQPLPLLLLLKMMKMKVGSVSCHTSTDKATIESNKQLILLNSLQMTSLLKRLKKRRSNKDRIPNQKNDSRQSHCHHQSLHVSTSTCSYCKVTIACWFTLQTSTSVSLITGPVPGTSGVDDQDVIDVTDPVRALAKQALADLCRKENQVRNIPDGKKIIETAVDVLKTLPRQEMQLTKSELQKTAADTGNL